MKPLSDLDDEGLSAELRRARHLRDAPEPVVRRAIDLFATRDRPAAAPSALQRVLAILNFDSAGAWLPAHGVRGTAGTSRQLLYSTEGRDIDLRILPADGRPPRDAGPWVIFGQLLGPDRGGRVELSCGDELRQVVLDEMLEFRFDGVPGGAVRLVLHLADRVIELPPLELPGSTPP